MLAPVVYGFDSASDTNNAVSTPGSEDDTDKVISNFQKTLESIAEESTPKKATHEATKTTPSFKKHTLVPRPSTSPDEPEPKTKKVKLVNTPYSPPTALTKSPRLTRSVQKDRKKNKGKAVTK
jgi:hypothetical protein